MPRSGDDNGHLEIGRLYAAGVADVRQIVVVIVSFNTRELLDSCLQSIVHQCASSDVVVVVDNASTDGSAEMVEQRFPTVEVVRSGGNPGFGSGCNLGAARYPGHDVLLLNSDAVAQGGLLDAFRTAAERLPDARMLGGRSLNPDGTPDLRSCWAAPSPWSTFCFATGLSSLLKSSTTFNPESMPGWDRSTEREVDMVSGALMFVERRLWDQLGGFDRRYFMYGEDLDLCLRAKALGARPTVIPSARMQHTVGGSSSSVSKRRLSLKGKITAILDHHRGGRGQFMRGCIVVGAAQRAALATVARRSSSWRSVWPERQQWWTGYGRTPKD